MNNKTQGKSNFIGYFDKHAYGQYAIEDVNIVLKHYIETACVQRACTTKKANARACFPFSMCSITLNMSHVHAREADDAAKSQCS